MRADGELMKSTCCTFQWHGYVAINAFSNISPFPQEMNLISFAAPRIRKKGGTSDWEL